MQLEKILRDLTTGSETEEMTVSREQRVRELAYLIWESEGRPAGCEQEHWERASREINDQPQALDDGGTHIVQASAPLSADTDDATQSALSPTVATRPKRAAKPAVKPAVSRSGKSTTSKKLG